MSSPADRNLALLREMYSSFQRKDFDYIVKNTSTDVLWNNRRTWASKTEHLQPRKGHQGVREFFSFIDKDIEYSVFDVQQFLHGDNVVLTRVHVVGKVRSTGKTFEDVELHWFRFDSEGKVREFEEFSDTAQTIAVFSKVL